jgi:hypothetical protein
MRTAVRRILLAVLALALGARVASAQTQLPYLQNEAAGTGQAGSEIAGDARGPNRPRPAIAHGIPTAHGAEFGEVFAGTTYQRFLAPGIPTGERNDGALFVGVGAGDAGATIGIDITHATYDVTGDAFSTGSLSLKLHRHIHGGLSVAVGLEDALRYGNWSSRSAYAVATQTIQTGRTGLTAVSATLGVGDGRFNTMSNLTDGKNRLGGFGSLSIEVLGRTSISATWYGQDLNLGLSVVVPGPIPVVLTPVWVSALNNHVDGDRFALGVGTRLSLR